MVALGSRYGSKIGLVMKPEKMYPPVEPARYSFSTVFFLIISRNTVMSTRARAISNLSTANKRNTVQSTAEVGLNPVSGQRARAFSNLSTVENKLEVQAKEQNFVKDLKWYLKQACIPWDPVEFEEFGLGGKIFSICFGNFFLIPDKSTKKIKLHCICFASGRFQSLLLMKKTAGTSL